MISFRTRADSTGSLLIIGAFLLLAGTAVWMYIPKPKPPKLSDNSKALAKLDRDTGQAEASNRDMQASIEPMLWTGTPDQVGPQALQSVTKLVKAHHLKLIAFRPQKPIDLVGLTQIPFSISVNGTYPDTMNFVKDLETSGSKLAVSLTQVTASDSSSDQVMGTVNINAYMKATVAAASASPQGNKNAQKS